jgi:hypothetical protein
MVLLVDQFLPWAVGGFLLFIFHSAGCCGWVVVILLLFGRFWVPISAWRLTIQIEIYYSFPQYLKLGHSHFLNTCFPIHYSVIIQSYDAVYIVWATEDIGKQMMNKNESCGMCHQINLIKETSNWLKAVRLGALKCV